MAEFEIQPRGPFSLAAAQDFAGGFAPGIGGGGVDRDSIAMAFPVEGTDSSAAVVLRQREDGVVVARTDAPSSLVDQVRRQAARSLSIDVDGTEWPAVGERDPVIGRLQQAHGFMRPVCFYSAYEAATSFVIGQRIAMRQSARIKAWLGEHLGDRPTVDGHEYAAFPPPDRLLEAGAVPGLNDKKVGWLHGLARAALDGRLETERLRAMERDEALDFLRALPGVGPFTAEAVWLRGCAIVDELPSSEDVSFRAAAEMYDRPGLTRDDYVGIAQAWRPYRMWATVLLRVGWNREFGSHSYRQQSPK
jgi:DNA-3-methyladenine glycosylase II